MTDRVETPKQLAERVGVSERQIRNLIRNGELEYVKIGSRIHLPLDAWHDFIQRKRQRQWRDETKDHDSGGIATEPRGTSAGQKTAAAASARLAQQAAKKLKSSLQSGCKSEGKSLARVIRLKRS